MKIFDKSNMYMEKVVFPSFGDLPKGEVYDFCVPAVGALNITYKTFQILPKPYSFYTYLKIKFTG